MVIHINKNDSFEGNPTAQEAPQIPETQQVSKDAAIEAATVQQKVAVDNLKNSPDIKNLQEIRIKIEQNKSKLNILNVGVYIANFEGKKIKITISDNTNGDKNISPEVLQPNEKPSNIQGGLIIPQNNTSKSGIQVVPIEKVAPELVSRTDTFSDGTTSTTTFSPDNSSNTPTDNTPTETVSFSPSEIQEFNGIYDSKKEVLKNGNVPLEINKNMNIPANLAVTILNVAKKSKNTTTIDGKDMNGFNYQFSLPGNCDQGVANILITRSIASVQGALTEFAAGETLQNFGPENGTNSNNIEAIKNLKVSSMQYFFDTMMPWSRRAAIAQGILNMKAGQPFEWGGRRFDLATCHGEDKNSVDPFALQTCRSQVAFAYMASYMCNTYGGSQKVSNGMTYMYLVSKSGKYSSQTVGDVFTPGAVIPFCRPNYIETSDSTDGGQIMDNIRSGLEKFGTEYQQEKQQTDAAMKSANILESFQKGGLPGVMDKVFGTLKDQYHWTDAQVDSYKQWAKIGGTIGAIFAGYAVLKYLWGKKDKFTAKNITLVLAGLGIGELVAVNNGKSLFAEAGKLFTQGKNSLMGYNTNPDSDLQERYKISTPKEQESLDQVGFMGAVFGKENGKSMNVEEISKYIKEGQFDYDKFVQDHPNTPATILATIGQIANDPARMQQEIGQGLALLGLATIDDKNRITLTAPKEKTVAQAVKEYATGERKIDNMIANARTFFTLDNSNFSSFRQKLNGANADTINLVSNRIGDIFNEKNNSKFDNITSKYKASPKSFQDGEILKADIKNLILEEIGNLKNGMDPQQANYIDLNALSNGIDSSISQYVQTTASK